MTKFTFFKSFKRDMAPLALAFSIAFATGVIIADTVSVAASTNNVTASETAVAMTEPAATPDATVAESISEPAVNTPARNVRTIVADGSEERARRARLEQLAIGG